MGTGEYTTGYVGGAASGSDKKVGVVGLSLFDLRRRGKVGKLSMVGVSGAKFPGIRTYIYIPVIDWRVSANKSMQASISKRTSQKPTTASMSPSTHSQPITSPTPTPTKQPLMPLSPVPPLPFSLQTRPTTQLHYMPSSARSTFSLPSQLPRPSQTTCL